MKMHNLAALHCIGWMFSDLVLQKPEKLKLPYFWSVHRVVVKCSSLEGWIITNCSDHMWVVTPVKSTGRSPWSFIMKLIFPIIPLKWESKANTYPIPVARFTYASRTFSVCVPGLWTTQKYLVVTKTINLLNFGW